MAELESSLSVVLTCRLTDSLLFLSPHLAEGSEQLAARQWAEWTDARLSTLVKVYRSRFWRKQRKQAREGQNLPPSLCESSNETSGTHSHCSMVLVVSSPCSIPSHCYLRQIFSHVVNTHFFFPKTFSKRFLYRAAALSSPAILFSFLNNTEGRACY